MGTLAKSGTTQVWVNGVTVLGLICCMNGAVLAREHQPDIVEIIKETQKISGEGNHMTIVWWVPTEFWEISLAQDPTVTQAQVRQLVEVLRLHTLLAVVDGKSGPFGGITYRSEMDIRASIQVVDTRGNTYRPIEQRKVDPDLRSVLGMLKPFMANMAGDLGQNMHFLVFPGRV